MLFLESNVEVDDYTHNFDFDDSEFNHEYDNFLSHYKFNDHVFDESGECGHHSVAFR